MPNTGPANKMDIAIMEVFFISVGIELLLVRTVIILIYAANARQLSNVAQFYRDFFGFFTRITRQLKAVSENLVYWNLDS